LKIDLIEGTDFDSMEHFKQELEEYLYYYNHLRPHQEIGARTPVEFNNNLK
jgi:transposase InsO family protein